MCIVGGKIEKIAEILEKAKQVRELPHLVKVDIEEKLSTIYNGKIITVPRIRQGYIEKEQTSGLRPAETRTADLDQPHGE